MGKFRDREASPASSQTGGDWLRQFAALLDRPDASIPFATKNVVTRVGSTLRLRRFGRARGAVTTLIVAPFAVQDAGFLDLMAGHSLVRALCDATKGSVYLTDWIDASPEMRHFGVDDYLSDLNVALDDLGGSVNLVGVSQGGLLATMLAARFPKKVAKLVLAGAPLDLAARESDLGRLAQRLVQARDGLPDDDVIEGAQWLGPLGSQQTHERGVLQSLQRDPGAFSRADLEAVRGFEDWSRRRVEIPGRYAREMLTLLAGNALAEGSFVALGKTLDLATIRAPLYVLAGAFDEIAPKEQALAAVRLFGTARAKTRRRVARCGHYALFTGARTLADEWRTIGYWLTSQAPLDPAHAMAGKVANSAP